MTTIPRELQDGATIMNVVAFQVHHHTFYASTTTIREIRNWRWRAPIPDPTEETLGTLDLRGTMVPVIDLATRLDMGSSDPGTLEGILIADIHGKAIGLAVDGVMDILTILANRIDPVPAGRLPVGMQNADGVITETTGPIGFLNLERMF